MRLFRPPQGHRTLRRNALEGVAADDADNRSGEPFPLKRRFFSFVVPGLVIFVIALIMTTFSASRGALEEIYLEQGERRAEGIAAGVARTEPNAWEHLLAGARLTESDFVALEKALRQEMKEFDLPRLKMYGLDATTLFSEVPEQIGTIEENWALREVLSDGEAVLRWERQGASSAYYELYVPFRDSDGRKRAVFELYEPVAFLDSLLFRAALPVVLVPGSMLLILAGALSLLVVRAQDDIDERTRTIDSLRQRLESFVSRRATDAIRAEHDPRAMRAELVECALLFSDVRGFTAFSEHRTPREVIEFLNNAMRLQVTAIEEVGGDVDKMIGDAVFARFHGSDRQSAALRAAEAIHRTAHAARLDLPFGIGIYSGTVVTGAVGAGRRFDYTAVGDGVNVASRLCNAAKPGETVADMATVEAADPRERESFGPQEALSVKGRQVPLTVRRARFQPL